MTQHPAPPDVGTAVAAGIGWDVPALTINKVCLSGIDAIALADQLIRAGEFDVVVAGGQEVVDEGVGALVVDLAGDALDHRVLLVLRQVLVLGIPLGAEGVHHLHDVVVVEADAGDAAAHACVVLEVDR